VRKNRRIDRQMLPKTVAPQLPSAWAKNLNCLTFHIDIVKILSTEMLELTFFCYNEIQLKRIFNHSTLHVHVSLQPCDFFERFGEKLILY